MSRTDSSAPADISYPCSAHSRSSNFASPESDLTFWIPLTERKP